MLEKLQELMLYIAHKSHDDQYFGATKLNKILFLADFSAYASFGKSITGLPYTHQRHGPVPKDLLGAQSRLLESGRATLEERSFLGYTQKRLKAVSNTDLSIFTPAEVQIVTDVMRHVGHMSASELSDLTHKLQPWLNTVDGEEIPYFTTFVMRQLPATMDHKQWGIQRLQELQVA